jgi:hypothetical protein
MGRVIALYIFALIYVSGRRLICIYATTRIPKEKEFQPTGLKSELLAGLKHVTWNEIAQRNLKIIIRLARVEFLIGSAGDFSIRFSPRRFM